MKSIVLETKALTKTFRGNDEKALDRVSLRIPEGCVYGLLGPNGAGKSTLLKIITGMVQPDEGQVLFKGQPWSRQALAKTGVLIETPPLYGNLSARENLLVRTTALGLPESRISQVLETVELTDTGKKKAGSLPPPGREKKKAGKFSLGMKQRLGIAAALLSEPELLILDEPTNGLDPFGIQKLRAMLREFASGGMTVLVSSHILGEVEQMADHIGILSGGVLGYQGGMPQKGHLEELFTKVVEKNRKGEWQA